MVSPIQKYTRTQIYLDMEVTCSFKHVAYSLNMLKLLYEIAVFPYDILRL